MFSRDIEGEGRGGVGEVRVGVGEREGEKGQGKCEGEGEEEEEERRESLRERGRERNRTRKRRELTRAHVCCHPTQKSIVLVASPLKSPNSTGGYPSWGGPDLRVVPPSPSAPCELRPGVTGLGFSVQGFGRDRGRQRRPYHYFQVCPCSAAEISR